MSPAVQTAVVIGGGLAGISAALALARGGVAVTLLESRQRLGGRAASFTLRNDRGEELETVDYCQHVGMGCCHNLRQLIDWLGQVDDWQVQRVLHFFGPQGTYQRLSAWPVLPAPLHLTPWLLKWPGLRPLDRLCIARGMWAIDRLRDLPATQQQIALDWLRSTGQTPRAIERFWSTIIVSALGEELSRTSLAAVAKVLQDGFLRHRDAYHLLVPQRPLGELFGSRAQQHLQRLGVDVQLATPVGRLVQRGGGRWEVHTAGRCFSSQAVVLAVPWHQLSKIDLPGDIPAIATAADAARQLQPSPISGVHTWWDRAWLDVPHAAIVGRLSQWVFPKPNPRVETGTSHPTAAQQPAARPSAAEGFYYQVVISASRGLRGIAPSELAGTLHADLGKVFPAVRSARLLEIKAVTDPQAVFSMTPASYEHRPGSQLGPRLVLAGDWTQTGWPATMEGAILSGFTAARQLSIQQSALTQR